MSNKRERRLHELRMRARVRRIFTDMSEHFVMRIANNRAHCSRYCCGNPRKYFKEKTIQEQKADFDFEDLDELR